MKKNNPVQKSSIGNSRYPVGTCWVIIPGGVDRGDYIQNCYRKSTVACLFEDGSFSVEIPVGLSILQHIDFPKEIEQLGSQLLYVTMPIHNEPIIIDKLLKDDESTNLIENEFKLQRYTDSGSVSISGVAKDGNLFINVSGRNENGGKIFIDVDNPEKKGEIIVNIKGDFKSELQNMVLNILKDLNIIAKGDINLNPTEDGKKVNLGSGDQPILLGDDTVSELEKDRDRMKELQTAINGWTVVANDGGAALKAALVDWLLKDMADYSDVKSEKSFTE